jgi:sucrose synthase
MYQLIQAVLDGDEKTILNQLIGELRNKRKDYLLRNEILHAFEEYCHHLQKPAYFYHSSSLGQLIHATHEILIEEESIWFLVRPRIASQEIYRVATDLSSIELMTPQALLDLRDRIVNRFCPKILEIDLSPFYEGTPIIDDPRNIGQGLEFLNRYLANKLFDDPQHWQEGLFNFLHCHQHDGISLLINDRISTATQLLDRVQKAIHIVSQLPSHEPYKEFYFQLQELGFEVGWGNTATRVWETLELLERLILSPEPAVLEAFIARIPITFRVVLISIHGWVAQEGVLGRSETAGQVVYVLDQARNLEHRLRENLHLAGLDLIDIQPQVVVLTRLIQNCEGTACDRRLEKIYGTENAWILRVPFQDGNPQITHNWISKFEIWPYLETFAHDAERELTAQLRGHPDLIIGNYSDGNLVASILSRRFKAIQCNIAHSLEKSKRLFSDLYWQDLEQRYHFSVQFTADLISMNSADFIIASSHQEIVGTPDSIGQYESYKCFSMPELYHVVDGIELFSPKFNVVPPGVNESIFFPYTQIEERVDRDRIHDLLFTRDEPHILGKLENPNKRAIFSVGPINSIKNLTGLVECFGKSAKLQEHCNLIFVLSKLDPNDATTAEEKNEIEKLHELIENYQLYHKIRWIGMRLTSRDLGEVYRAIADGGGIYVHPARFEAFGLAILEAAISGLPVFATQFGGSQEIIQDGRNGFHIDPTDLEGTAKIIVNFCDRAQAEPNYWHEISQRASERVREQYTWREHIKKLLLLAKIYRFWNSVAFTNRKALHRYLELIFHLIYKPRAEKSVISNQ